MKRFLYILLFLTSWVSVWTIEPIKIAVVSDVHYLSSQLAGKGTALEKYETATGRNTEDLHAVLDKVISDLLDECPDILLIPGDITNNGEKQSHLDFKEKLLPLTKNGTQVFVVPGNHDINVPTAKKYIGDKAEPVESVSAEEFAAIYSDFGYGKVVKRDTASLSYLAFINDSLWLLCFDTNRYNEYRTSSISSGRILPQTLNWALDILHEAKEKNIDVIGMMHHGLVEHMPYQSAFFSEYLIDDWKKNAEILADNGLKIVFTGHFHANDITSFTSPAGNTITDVETGSLAQYPFPYRLILLENNTLKITPLCANPYSGASFHLPLFFRSNHSSVHASNSSTFSPLSQYSTCPLSKTIFEVFHSPAGFNFFLLGSGTYMA
jgi:predicted MPP superfamily phosphohydrolase